LPVFSRCWPALRVQHAAVLVSIVPRSSLLNGGIVFNHPSYLSASADTLTLVVTPMRVMFLTADLQSTKPHDRVREPCRGPARPPATLAEVKPLSYPLQPTPPPRASCRAGPNEARFGYFRFSTCANPTGCAPIHASWVCTWRSAGINLLIVYSVFRSSACRRGRGWFVEPPRVGSLPRIATWHLLHVAASHGTRAMAI